MSSLSTHEPPLIAVDRLRRGTRPIPQGAIDVRGLWAALRASVEGEVRFDPGSQALYAVDASNYRQVPLGVVLPKSADDVVAAVAAARRFGAPLLARGGGTALAGQTCNEALVLDFSKYMNRVLEVNPEGRFARVQPGTICDTVIDAARQHRLTWGPAPATHDRCCFGGMIANDSGGAHAQMSGSASNNVEELDILLYDGTRMRAGWMNEADMDAQVARGGRAGEVHAGLRALRDRYAPLIRERFPSIPRRVSGYNLDQLLPAKDGRFNLARALVGSEGTLVTMLEAKVRLVDEHPERVVLVVGFEDVYQAGDAVPLALESAPIALEGMDRLLFEKVEKKGGPHAKYLPLMPAGGGWLFIEIGDETQSRASDRAHQLMDRLRKHGRAGAMKIYTDPWEQGALWKVRESGLGATAFVPGEPDTWPGWEDSSVRPDLVGPYLRDLRKLFDLYGYHPSLYGHFGMGCIHCRVDFDLVSATGVANYERFAMDAAHLVRDYGGSLSGEHGDGQSRAELLSIMFGPEVVQAFREYKAIWDPDGKMNPGKIVDPHSIHDDLKLGAHYRPWEPDTHFQFPEDKGSFAHATLRCVGVGKCRRLSGESPGDDTMCPSFMVTREEKHTTRGRAHLLWEMLEGGPIEGGWRNEDVKDALDLCLACKGCKGDCPVNVDIATYKAEFLSHYWEGRLRPLQAYTFGWIDKWARLASIAPGLANIVTQLPGLRALAKWAAGIPQARQIPAFAPRTFRQWFEARGRRRVGAPQVMLWPDTFNNHLLPETAEAAVEVLEAAGHEVVLPRVPLCCGRPLYDYGFLGMAERYLRRVLDALAPDIERGTPLVVLEPSCASVFRDELKNLFPEREDARRLASQTMLLSEFLQHVGYEPPPLHRKAIVQGHCHHKAVARFDAESAVLKGMGLDSSLLNSGCCGMAGAFGYERDKYDVSMKAGERALLPAVRSAAPSTLVLADGFSCREQIAQNTDRHALHLAQAMTLASAAGAEGPTGAPPERGVVLRRQRGVRNSMIREGVVAAVVVAAAALAWRRLRSRR